MNNTINLKKLHPHSIRYFCYLLAPWVAGLGLILLSSTLGHSFLNQSENISNIPLLDNLTSLLFSGFLAALILRAFYCALYLKRYAYEVRSGNLIISKGIFLRKQGSFPLRRITDVYTRNNWKTFLFGLYEVEVLTPSAESKDFSHIEGLSRRTALALKERLLTLIEEQDRALPLEIARESNKVKAYVPSPSRRSHVPAHQPL